MLAHGKSFLMGLVGTTQGRLGWAGDEAQKLMPEIEKIISEAEWLASEDFDTIHYVMRFGVSAQERIPCRRNRKDDELEVASEVAMEALHRVFLDRRELRRFLCRELQRVFDHLEGKYRLEPLPKLKDFLEAWPDKA